MLGGTCLILLVLTVTVVLGINKWIAAFLCISLGGYVLYSAFSGLGRLYLEVRTTEIRHLIRLFASGALYGLTSPFYISYLLVRVFVLKRMLIATIKKCNASALARRQTYYEMHKNTMTMRDDLNRKSKVLPRGHSKITTLRAQIEKVRYNLQQADEDNETYLLQCRQQARELGIVLQEQDNIVSLPPNTSVLRILAFQMRKATAFSFN